MFMLSENMLPVSVDLIHIKVKAKRQFDLLVCIVELHKGFYFIFETLLKTDKVFL